MTTQSQKVTSKPKLNSKRDCWNKCNYCGKFISLEDFGNGKAIRNMVTPDSYLSLETWETYHTKCGENL